MVYIGNLNALGLPIGAGLSFNGVGIAVSGELCVSRPIGVEGTFRPKFEGVS